MASEKSPIRKRDSQLSKETILKAARDEFCRLGLAGARIDEIADKAKINKRMIYHYFGGKIGLYSAVLEQAYREIREGELHLDLSKWSPEHGMRHLVSFTFQHFKDHPWFIRLVINENIHEAEYLKKLDNIATMHPPLLKQIDELLKRGEKIGVYRAGIDPMDLYMMIASLGFFYFSNAHTLGFVFSQDFLAADSIDRWEQHMIDVIMRYLAV